MKILELFSGTHSIGKVAKLRGFDIVSLDRDLSEKCPFTDYTSNNHIKEDIMEWNYKEYSIGEFDLITASPVCLWWSVLRNMWIGRKCKKINPNGDIVKKEDLEKDIIKYGVPMVDKVFEIIEYFKPKFYIIENPQTGKMKDYIKKEYNEYNNYFDVDYCKYSKWGYSKRTRIWTNITTFKPKLCKKDCDNIIISNKGKLHKTRMSCAKTIIDNGIVIRITTKELRQRYKDYENIQPIKNSNKYERYRIPSILINELIDCCIIEGNLL